MAAQGASRLLVSQGKLLLVYPTLQDLGCLLLELDEKGCRCSVSFQNLDTDMQASWKNILTPQRQVHVKVEVLPWLVNFETEGSITNISDLPSHSEIDLFFSHIPPSELEILQRAVLSMATQKVRHSTHILTAKARDSRLKFSEDNPAPTTHDVKSDTALAPKDARPVLKLKKIGEVLIHMGWLSSERVEEAVTQAHNKGEKLGRYLIRVGWVTPDVLCRALALQSGLPMTDLDGIDFSENLRKIFSYAVMLQHTFVPFDEAKNFICIATASPLKPGTVKNLETLCNKRVEVFLAQEDLIVKQLDMMQNKNKRRPRKYIRYSVSLPVRYQYCSRLGTPAEQIIYDGETVDISEGGLLIEGSPTTLGTLDDLRRRGICVRISINIDSGEVVAICQLRALRNKPGGPASHPRWMIGLEVVEASVDCRRRLKEVCIKSAMSTRKVDGSRRPFI